MNIKRWIPILVGIVLISFGLGFFSLIYNDNFSFKNSFINIGNKDEIVRIGPRGIEVKDGKSHVEISWKGIKVRDGDELVDIGWNGIRVNEDGKSKVNIGGNWSWTTSKDLQWQDIDVKELLDIKGVDNIKISTPFINIKVRQENRDDVKIHYHGSMKTNVVPKYSFEKTSRGNIEIIIGIDKDAYSVIDTDVILEVFIPREYNGTLDVESISGDIYMNDLKVKEFNINTTSGDMDLEDLVGEIININTVSGDIELEDSMGRLSIDTTSGDIYLDNEELRGNIKLSTVSGDIFQKLSPKASYVIEGKTTSGDFISKIDMNIKESSRNSFKAVIGSGEKLMEIITTSGDVYFNRAD